MLRIHACLKLIVLYVLLFSLFISLCICDDDDDDDDNAIPHNIHKSHNQDHVTVFIVNFRSLTSVMVGCTQKNLPRTKYAPTL